MTAEEFKGLELGEEDKRIYIESGLEWLRDNTTLQFEVNNTESIQALPSSARLFLLKFCELSEKNMTVSSESIGGMSQSFVSGDTSAQINTLARQLLKKYLKSNVTFIPCLKRWE